MEASVDEPSGHPLQASIDALEAISDEDIRGTNRLGSLAFDDASQKVREIQRILEELTEEDWEALDNGFKSTLTTNATTLLQALEAMRQLSAGDANAATDPQTYEQQLNDSLEWFRSTARPRARRAWLRSELGRTEQGAALEEGALVHRQLEELRREAAELRSQLEAIEPVVEAGRVAAGESASIDLAEVYSKQADDHATDWRSWRWIFLGSVALAIAGSLAVVLIGRPSGEATSAEAVSRFLIDLLIIGLLLYLVRVLISSVPGTPPS